MQVDYANLATRMDNLLVHLRQSGRDVKMLENATFQLKKLAENEAAQRLVNTAQRENNETLLRMKFENHAAAAKKSGEDMLKELLKEV